MRDRGIKIAQDVVVAKGAVGPGVVHDHGGTVLRVERVRTMDSSLRVLMKGEVTSFFFKKNYKSVFGPPVGRDVVRGWEERP